MIREKKVRFYRRLWNLFIPGTNLIDLPGNVVIRNQRWQKCWRLPQLYSGYETMIDFYTNQKFKYTNPEEGTINGMVKGWILIGILVFLMVIRLMVI